MNDSLFDSLNAAYAQALYEEFARNPEAVPAEWREFFSRGEQETREAGLLTPESLTGNEPQVRSGPQPVPEPWAPEPAPAVQPDTVVVAATEVAEAPPPTPSGITEESVRRLLSLVAQASYLVQSFREHGHQEALIDPLGSDPPGHPELDPAYFGTTMEELEAIPTSVVFPGGGEDPLATTLTKLRETYSGSIGYEFEHLENPETVRWLWDQVERGRHYEGSTDEDRLRTLERLTWVEGFEQFLHRAYLGQKRFSIEGTDLMVPMLDEAIEIAAADGATHVVLGMAHRGRLNVLTHIVGVPHADLIREFEGMANVTGALAAASAGTGDVKYHHGATGDYTLRNGETIKIILAPNPSHLEYVNPVVLGMARAWQYISKSEGGERDLNKVVPILIHGDAAFAAEGVVAETLNLARLTGYDVGGTLHIIANNQVGFTTDPHDGRSTRYASDLAKGYDIPVLHVNGDDPEAGMAAVRLAMAYRKQFNEDMVIDLVGYRRHGHNEGDEPGYTQPTLYKKISNHPTVRTLWSETLVERDLISEEGSAKLVSDVLDHLRGVQDQVKDANGHRTGETDYAPLPTEEEPDTRVDLDTVREINDILLSRPDGFQVHPKLERQLTRRGKDFGPDFTMEWAHAEALAFGSLLKNGIPIRMSGQDAERGTFSQRHLVLHDVETGQEITPVADAAPTRFEVYNSPLTEAAVIGFEYGYAVAAEKDLVLWEAQFGDFVNVAQVLIDQFIAAGWAKWGQRSRLSLLLPHGYEGQGPEHSSARLERFLQLCAEDNMRVVYPSTPAQYFHLLRKQALAKPEKPLIVMTPKSLLRHPAAVSAVSELTDQGFQKVIDDPGVTDASEIRRVILCTGKVYYDLQGSEHRSESPTTAIARIESLYPFPEEEIRALTRRYEHVEEIIWTQEEPGNMGALAYIGPRLRAAIPRTVRLRYVARPERASPAEGHSRDHVREQERLVHEALQPGR